MKNYYFFKRTGAVFVLKVITAGISFFLQVLISRHLGIDEYGIFSIFCSLSTILVIFPLLGTNTGLIREVAFSKENKAQNKGILIYTLKISTSILIILIPFIYLIKDFFLENFYMDKNIVIYLIINISILVYTNILSAFLQGEKRNILNDGIVTLTTLIKIVLLIIIYNMINSLYITLIVYIIGEFIGLLIKIVVIEKDYLKIKKIEKKKNEKREYILYCLPLCFVSSISILQITIHKFVVAYMMDPYSVGIMKICENYATALMLFIAPFSTMWPLMAQYYKENKMEELKNLFYQSSLVVTILVLPAFITLLICNKEIFDIFNLNTDGNLNLILILGLFCLGTVSDAIIGPVGALLNMTKYSKIGLYNSLILLIGTILFSFIFIPKWGLVGAALAAALSNILIKILNAYQNKRLFNIFPYGKIHLILIVSGIPIFYFLSYIKSIFSIGTLENILFMAILIYLIYIILAILICKEIKKVIKNILKKKGESNKL